jgi:hypothetical protein
LTAVEPQVLERVARGWTYDSSNKTLRVKLEDRPSREVVTFE